MQVNSDRINRINGEVPILIKRVINKIYYHINVFDNKFLILFIIIITTF